MTSRSPPAAPGFPFWLSRAKLARHVDAWVLNLFGTVYGAGTGMDRAAVEASLLSAQAEHAAGNPRWTRAELLESLPATGWWPANYDRCYDAGNRPRSERARKVPRPPATPPVPAPVESASANTESSPSRRFKKLAG